MRAAATAGLAVLVALGPVAPAGALSCAFLAFQLPGQRFGKQELVAQPGGLAGPDVPGLS
jgi:hypothetical protein